MTMELVQMPPVDPPEPSEHTTDAKPVPPSPTKQADPEELARARVAQCQADVAAVLNRYGCRIVAFLTTDTVPLHGQPGLASKAIVGASWGIDTR